ncbi:ABC transporter ATP-binding protein [Paenibacillus sp. ATY16]|uniref:ABC transporter ATP-binding protein n=1 Tax=Paenibacillus sp. ATY16 TaxID=1759312 RepID=UPI00200FF468|nr:ABC transporter ATP-binding protein [Paenibacillus sp. ATY16]MCK9862808.1 ABC transporter ATP-binding protein [Paenibacillus sp. ATY16]
MESFAQAPIIEMSRLTKKYGEQTAVSQLDLTIHRGEVYGLLGPNGAGKTTTILMMLGLTEPSSGKVRVCGLDPARQPLEVKRRVGYMPDDVGFYEDRTALDNLLLTARLNGIPIQDARIQALELLERVGLQHTLTKRVGAFSRGMRQRLGIADVLIKKPEIIILDEPTLGIDPEGVRELLELIEQLSRNEGLTVLLSSHHLHQVQQICDRVGLFVQGKLIASGNIESLAKQLDDDGSVTVELSAAPWSKELDERLSGLDGLLTYKGPDVSDHAYSSFLPLDAVITGTRDLTSEAARIVLDCGASLFGIRRKQYGLDDIYHRYFEGGGQLERSNGIQ